MMKVTDKQERRPESERLQGVVTARKCDCCGHHELGLTSDTGEYVPLKPGMRVLVITTEADEP